jgi:hypothetical protein
MLRRGLGGKDDGQQSEQEDACIQPVGDAQLCRRVALQQAELPPRFSYQRVLCVLAAVFTRQAAVIRQDASQLVLQLLNRHCGGVHDQRGAWVQHAAKCPPVKDREVPEPVPAGPERSTRFFYRLVAPRTPVAVPERARAVRPPRHLPLPRRSTAAMLLRRWSLQ